MCSGVAPLGGDDTREEIWLGSHSVDINLRVSSSDIAMDGVSVGAINGARAAYDLHSPSNNLEVAYFPDRSTGCTTD